MKYLPTAAIALALLFTAAISPSFADGMTWAQTVQAKIAGLDLSDAQKADIGKAFDASDSAYADAVAATRKDIGATLSSDQKKQLGDMADSELQRRLEGDASARTKSIGEIGEMLGITSDQSDALKKSMSALGGSLDAIDAKLISQIKSVLNEKQLAEVASWLM